MEEKIGYKTIDLGLPSSLLWSNKNIGAETEEDAGLYFQWGDTEGYTAEQVGVDKQFDSGWSDYKWGTNPNFTKYNSSDGLVTLEAADDAATQIMGSDWRMPTRAEFQELVNNTDIYLVSIDNNEIQAIYTGGIHNRFTFLAQDTMKGIKFYNKSDRSKYIFVPALGDAFDGSAQDIGVYGDLWSSSLYTSGVYNAWNFFFYAPVGDGFINVDYRYFGLNIRGVKSK